MRLFLDLFHFVYSGSSLSGPTALERRNRRSCVRSTVPRLATIVIGTLHQLCTYVDGRAGSQSHHACPAVQHACVRGGLGVVGRAASCGSMLGGIGCVNVDRPPLPETGSLRHLAICRVGGIQCRFLLRRVAVRDFTAQGHRSDAAKPLPSPPLDQ